MSTNPQYTTYESGATTPASSGSSTPSSDASWATWDDDLGVVVTSNLVAYKQRLTSALQFQQDTQIKELQEQLAKLQQAIAAPAPVPVAPAPVPAPVTPSPAPAPLAGPNYRQFAENLLLNTTTSGTGLGGLDPSGTTSAYTNIHTELSPVYTTTDLSGAPPPVAKVSTDKTITFNTQNVPTIVMLDSTNRDKAVYPQPTNVTLLLPRTYRSVTTIQIVQIKLLSAFFYFRAEKGNLSITVHEKGRYLPPGSTDGKLNTITSIIREGTYDINTLINELTIQLNRTPIFYDYEQGFADFAPLFASTGDYSLNFNEPGDNYFDALNNQFILSPTMTQIVQKYFQNTNASLSGYTLDQIKVAYYYPVLKEALLDKDYLNKVDLDVDLTPLLPTETVRSRCIYTFQGINDPIVLEVINLNLIFLDEYRLAHTFRYSLINKYVITYQPNNNRINFLSTQLNTSLTNLIDGKYAQYLSEQLSKFNITQEQYAAISVLNTALLAILTDEYYYIQRMFSIYFGVQFNSYSLVYYTDVENQIPIQNAYRATGISSNYDINVISKNISPQTVNTLEEFRVPPKHYWNTLTSISTTIAHTFNLNSNTMPSTISEYNHPYNTILDKSDELRAFIDSNGSIYQNQLFAQANTVVPIEATQYTVFNFTSPVRQTLRVSAFPRPDKYRYPAYNPTVYDASHVRLFDNSYCFIENAQVDIPYATSNLLPISTVFGMNFNSSFYNWESNISLNVQNNRTFFTFLAPPAPTTSTSRYSLNLTVKNTVIGNFPSPMKVFLYHDRSAFMADISDVRNESPLHYVASQTISNVASNDLTFTAYANQRYYAMIRSLDTTFITESFRPVVWFPNGSNYETLTNSLVGFNPLVADLTNYNYASVADSNFLRLPINQLGKYTNNGKDSNLSDYTYNFVKMGYDTNDVSTDLTDYVGYDATSTDPSYINPKSTYRIDPITGYIFQVASAYNTSNELYLYNGSGNVILSSNAAAKYTNTTPKSRESVIVHWYDTLFIVNSPSQEYRTDSNYSSDFGNIPYNDYSLVPGYIASNGLVTGISVSNANSYVIPGYSYDNRNALTLGNGVCGISLIPDDGVWDLSKIMLKSAYHGPPSEDPNAVIKYLGVYVASQVNNVDVTTINLSSATMVLSFNKSMTYNSNSSNFGFAKVPGTYYEWKKDTSFSNKYLYGFAQSLSTIVTDTNSYYTVLPFKADSTLTTYSALTGTPVPYFPFYSYALPSTTTVCCQVLPGNLGTVIPKTRPDADATHGPAAGTPETQSHYEQSIPITTSHLQYQYQVPYCSNASSLYVFGGGSFSTVVGSPLFTDAVFRVKEFALFNIAGGYSIYSYTSGVPGHSFKYEATITPDQIFTNLNNASVVGVSGHENEFAFLGMEQTVVSLPPDTAYHIYTYRFQIATYNPINGVITTRDLFTSSNAFYYPGTPIPATLMPGYTPPVYALSPLGSYKLLVTDVTSFNYTISGGFSFTYTLEYGGSYKETWGVSKATPIDDTSTYPYLIHPRKNGPYDSRVELLQAGNERFGNHHIVYYQDKASVSLPGLKYAARDFIYGGSNSATPSLFSVDYISLSSNTYGNNGFPMIQPWGSPSTISTAITRPVFPTISGIQLLQRNTTLNPNPSLFGIVSLIERGQVPQLVLGYDMYDMNLNGNPTISYYQVVKQNQYGQLSAGGSSNLSQYYYSPALQPIMATNGTLLCPYTIQGGFGGSLWFTMNETNRITAMASPGELTLTYASIWGNRNDRLDNPTTICNAYQIFYPTQRIVMSKVAKGYDPMTDISGFSTLEWPHTNMFAYNDTAKFMKDISANKWGLESPTNYLVSDTRFSGTAYNAATLDVPLLPSTPYYLAVRGYTPTEKSQVMLRFSLPGNYNFGYTRFRDISNEIIYSSQRPDLFNSNYTNTLASFNSNFIFGSTGKIFGSNILQGFNGSNLSNVTGFGDFLDRFIDLYTVYQSNVSILSTINTNVQSNITKFINNDLQYIIPPASLSRQRYTDPIIYSILWKSSLTPQYAMMEDNWGLGWNLGFNKVDTPYDTTQVAPSFYKILDDYISLQLNQEYDMNRMDTGAKENRAISLEPTGFLKAFHGKLLLAPFGSYAQTLISNPVNFTIPIPRLDKLTFTWSESSGAVINNSECDWNVVVQIVEEIQSGKPAAGSQVIPPPP